MSPVVSRATRGPSDVGTISACAPSASGMRSPPDSGSAATPPAPSHAGAMPTIVSPAIPYSPHIRSLPRSTFVTSPVAVS